MLLHVLNNGVIASKLILYQNLCAAERALFGKPSTIINALALNSLNLVVVIHKVWT